MNTNQEPTIDRANNNTDDEIDAGAWVRWVQL